MNPKNRIELTESERNQLKQIISPELRLREKCNTSVVRVIWWYYR